VLAEPERTTYDLRFRLFGFPVRIHPFFWVGALLLGGDTALKLGVEFLFIWVAVVFVSILVHEMGHALAFRVYGAGADIVLYAFGGLAIPTFAIPGRGRRIVIALAGPFAGFALCGAVYGSNVAFAWATDAKGFETNGLPVWFLYKMLVAVNLYWGVFNLLPVFPLDGGQVSRELCGVAWGARGRRVSLQISFAVAALVAAYSLLCHFGDASLFAGLPWWFPLGSLWTAILFGLLAYESYQQLQQPDWTEDHWGR
jgi:stage IV sporulation protein FB